ncbi:DUF5719 family protein [Cellulomonas aerilata]|uniref:Secreted protein n=1 Tax=Cellulomonas aerilata TaxID=515326 RepID=A0A512DD91_9CELL|nr:DUF5719 family protein [Cellulomonas aerilata]GEO34444.1 hypothetical protein CAE01nite_21690 [Cellulomonas aerilata]
MSRTPGGAGRAGRLGRVVSGVGVAALLGGVTALGLRLPAAAPADDVRTVVPVPPTATTLVCPGPVVLAADDAASDAAFDPAPVETRTTLRAVSLPPSPDEGEPSTGTSSDASTETEPAPDAPAAEVSPLGGGAPLVTLDDRSVGGLDAVPGPTLVRAEPAGDVAVTAGAASASITTQGDLRGLAAASCRAPAASTWLVGGSTEIGSSALLVVANPGRTPAEVSLDLWGPTGALDPAGASTFLVAPGEQRGVLLEGVAAEQRRVAVHVSAAGGVVSAHVQDSRLNGFTPAGTDLVTAGTEPATRQVLTGVVVPASTLEEPDTALVRVLAPGRDRAVVRLTVLGPDGPVSLPGAERLDLGPGEVTDVSLAGLPAGAYTVVVDADTAVVAGAMLTREGNPVELGDVPTLERAWAAAVPVGETGVVAVPGGVVGTVVAAAVPPVPDDVLEGGAGSTGAPATGVLRVLGTDGTVLSSQDVDVPAGRTARFDLAALAAGVEVAAVELVPSGTDDPGRAALAWSVLATSGSGAQELVSVLSPVPAPDAQPDVVVGAADRLGLR